ncbi:hypothetical protein [Flavobacterium sp. LB2P74]|uniref:hypothetical protein n=1 Tax=Flavobacterium sp. LB2P74 TaxID=3401717 RepID=UPI003AACF643
MKNFYIYKFDYIVKSTEKPISATVIFCDNTILNEVNLKVEIKNFYEECSQTDKIFIIGGEYLQDEMIKVFIDNKESTFIGIPRREDTSFYENIYILSFNKSGVLKLINRDGDIPAKFKEYFLNEGLQNIFIKRGGLVETEGTHHYVFPSKKHCNKFLRTGNILLYSSEIYFIAFALLKHFDEEIHNQIYCDSSSINSIALSLSELKNRFNSVKTQIPIESFSSYDGLYKNDLNYKKNALLLISASTSANIITYILDSHKEIERQNIVVLFFLGNEKKYNNVKDKVLCNLTESKINPNGITEYNTYYEKDCIHCKSGSYPVQVSGDVFLLEKPKINSLLIGVTDADKKLSSFVEQFKSHKFSNTVLKTNYKEASPSNKYEIYIDFSEILDGIKNNRYEKYHKKLDAYINQFVPSNTRYIVYLNDNSSKELANYVFNKIIENYVADKLPELISQDDLTSDIKKGSVGSVLVVGSCISNGKNLLYLSRALRKFDKLRIVYFVGISRMKSKEALSVLKSNLKQGNYGPETSTCVEVESIHCLNNSKETSWVVEIDFLNQLITLLNDESIDNTTIDFFKNRLKNIQDSFSILNKGLSNGLFYPRVIKKPHNELAIRNNFAFFNFHNYVKDVTQSDIYFTISNILNGLRNSDKIDKSLKQTSFVRNLISPGNFNRFNDGIIQASILRSANADELSYSIDYDLSLEMKNILETLIKYHKDEQSEALLEFLYAISISKLSFKESHLIELIKLIESDCKDKIIKCFALYIRKNIIAKYKD